MMVIDETHDGMMAEALELISPPAERADITLYSATPIQI